MKYKPGDLVVCRSNFQLEEQLTTGKTYEVLRGDQLSMFLSISSSSDLMIVVMCDDGKERAISKIRFVPATEVVAKRGKLEVLKPARKRDS